MARLVAIVCEFFLRTAGFCGDFGKARGRRGYGLSAFGFAHGGKDFLGYGGLNCKVESRRLGWGFVGFFDWKIWFLY